MSGKNNLLHKKKQSKIFRKLLNMLLILKNKLAKIIKHIQKISSQRIYLKKIKSLEALQISLIINLIFFLDIIFAIQKLLDKFICKV